MTGRGATLQGDPMAHLRAIMADWPERLGPGTDEALVACLDSLYRRNRHEAYHEAGRRICPALARAIIDLMPDGIAAGRGDLGAAMAALDAVEDWLRRDGRRGAVQPVRRDIGRTLIARIDAIAERTRADLDREDHPDIRRIGLEAVKLDVIRMLLESYGGEAERAHLDSRLALIGRLTIRRVTRVVALAAASSELTARLDMALTLAGIDELLVLADRVLELELAERRDHPLLVAERVGLDVVERFIEALRNFAPILLAELEQRLEAGADYQIVRETWFRQLRQIIRFCERLEHPSVLAPMTEFSGFMRARLAQLEHRFRAVRHG